MMIRRYVVKDIPEAIVMIRKELGKDAVILDTRKVWAKRWFGLLRTRRIEVVAATGDDVPRRAVAGEVPQNLRQNAGLAATGTSRGMENSGATSTNSLFATNGSPVKNSLFATNGSPATSHRNVVPEAVMQVAATEVAVTTSPTSSPTGTNSGGDAAALEVKRLWAEVTELKHKLQATNQQSALPPLATEVADDGNRGPETVDPVLNRLWQHLLSQGVSQGHVERIRKQCEEALLRAGIDTSQEGQNFDTVRQMFVDVVQDIIGPVAVPKPLAPESRVIGMVGPTGVGKTTTIAKLAALHVLEGKRKVGLLTTDTFRIAAVDQLRTYANILNIPLQVVYQEADIGAALQALSDRDLILIDTAGRNFSNPKHVVDTQNLLGTLGCDEVHLVLSLTSKSDDLDALAAAFQGLPVTQVILTKLDETRSYGGALNLLLDFARPLSYVTMGQNVPDDIAVASTGKLLRLTAGGARF